MTDLIFFLTPSADKLDNIGGKAICGKRDYSYSYATIKRPEKKSKSGQKVSTWRCNDNSFGRLCGSDSSSSIH